MVRKINSMLSTLFIILLFCTTITLVNAQFGEQEIEEAKERAQQEAKDRTERVLHNLIESIENSFNKVAVDLDDGLSDIDETLISAVKTLTATAFIFIFGMLFLCILAPCVYMITSCIETCTDCCAGNKELRILKKNEKFKYLNARIATLETMNGIKTEIEIIDKDEGAAAAAAEKSVEKKVGKKPKGKGKGKGKKDAESKADQSVAGTVDGQEKDNNKSVQ